MPLRPPLHHALPLSLLALFAIAATLPELTPLLRWQRDMPASGEWYRLLSGHIVHANARHALANALALAALWLLFHRALSPRLWLLATPLCALAVGALLFATGVDWYVGFSGVLHGLLVLALCRDPRLTRPLRTLLLGAVAVKIGVELIAGGDSGDWLGIAVVSEAHAFGALGGALLAALASAVSGRGATAGRR